MKTAKWLIDSDVTGTLVTSKDNNGDTPAHDAADNGSVSILHCYPSLYTKYNAT